jgi:HAD superfamily hydrolase (TIGR01509 family)
MQAILFDLDGTLLPHDIDDFLPRYLALLTRTFAETLPGVDLARLVMASTQVMLANDGSHTNEEAFWSDFAPRFAQPRAELEPQFFDFYRERFPALGAAITPEASARTVVAACRELRLKTVLATNPLFPRLAIDERLRWAGLDAAQFDLITSYENMHYCKPHPGYFREIAEALGVPVHDCLMVGNDVKQDLQPAAAAGMQTCLVVNAYQVPAASGFAPDYCCPLAAVPDLLRRSSS